MKMVLSDDSRKTNKKHEQQQQGYGSSENNILSIIDDNIIDDDVDDEEKEHHSPNCLAPFQQQQQRDGAVTFYAPFVPLMKVSLSMIVVVTIGVVIMTTMSLHNISPPSVSTTRQQQQEPLLSLAGINNGNGMESTHSTAGLRGDDDDDDSNDYSFKEFCLKYNKNYNEDDEEYDRRKKIFNKNVQKIMHHNRKKESSFQLGINQFTDLNANELPLGLDKSASRRSSIPGIRAFSYELFPPSMENENESETDTLLPYNRKLQQLKKKKEKQGKEDGDDEEEEDDTDNDGSADTNTDNDDDAAIKLLASLPKSVDWRTVILPESNSRVTTPIKNQGHCGSCWAFASISALESHIALQTGFLFTFSTQELISCAPNQDHCGSVAGGYGGGCNGSTGELAYDFISSGRGIVTEWDWGYISYAGSRGTCPLQPSPFSADDDDNDATTTTTTTKSVKKHRKLYSSSDSSSSDSSSSDSSSSDSSSSDSSSSDSSSSDSSSSDSLLDLFSDVFSSVKDGEEKETTVDLLIPGAVASITGHTQLRINSYLELVHAVATKGPVVVNVAASEGWLSYHGGIFTDLEEESRDVNHVVVVEGYGTDPHTHQDFWLVRNSWGPLWGEQGYIRLHRVNPYNQRECTANAAQAAATAGNKLLDPCGECKMDLTPQDGIACVGPDFSIKPKPVMVCGTSGILYDAVLPVGGALL